MIICGNKLKKARIKKGRTLAEVAAAAGYKSSERIRQVEKGKAVNINPHIAGAIASYLGIDPGALV